MKKCGRLARAKAFALNASLFCGLGGCAWIDGTDNTASFSIEEAADSSDGGAFPACAAESFPMTFKQFESDEPFANFARIMMYESVARRISENILSVSFMPTDGETLEPCAGPEEIAGGEPAAISANGCVRATFAINRCEPARALRVIGELTLDAYSSKRGERISGSIRGTLEHVTKIELTDGTYAEDIVRAGTVTGTFSFNNRGGSVWNH